MVSEIFCLCNCRTSVGRDQRIKQLASSRKSLLDKREKERLAREREELEQCSFQACAYSFPPSLASQYFFEGTPVRCSREIHLFSSAASNQQTLLVSVATLGRLLGCVPLLHFFFVDVGGGVW